MTKAHQSISVHSFTTDFTYTSLTDCDAVQLCSNTVLTVNKQHQLAFTAHFHTNRSALLCRTVQSRNTWIW